MAGRLVGNKKLVCLLLAVGMSAGLSSQQCAAEESRRGALTLSFDNDLFTGSDNNYTNGMAASWSTAEVRSYESDNFIYTWTGFWSFLPFVDEDHRLYAAWSLGHEIHTPNDILVADPPLDDQPYAGILYLDNLIYARQGRWGHIWNLRLGVVGPASRAEEMQRWVHEIIGGDDPQGWGTQLPNEHLINVGFTTGYLWKSGEYGRHAEWRLIPTASVNLGNYFTGAMAGVFGETGWNLPDTFASNGLRYGLNSAGTIGTVPDEKWSASFFGGITLNGVIHYLPLDGTVFHESRSVDSNPFIWTVTGGLAVRRSQFALSLSLSVLSETFEGQRRNSDYGSVTFSWWL